LAELERQEDELHAWAAAQVDLFVELDEEQQHEVCEITACTRRFRSRGRGSCKRRFLRYHIGALLWFRQSHASLRSRQEVRRHYPSFGVQHEVEPISEKRLRHQPELILSRAVRPLRDDVKVRVTDPRWATDDQETPHLIGGLNQKMNRGVPSRPSSPRAKSEIETRGCPVQQV
jgi:hypothetical protein